MIEKAIVDILKNDAAVTALIKSATATPANIVRISDPSGIPQGWTLPAVYWERNGTDREQSLSGPNGYPESRTTLVALADTPGEAMELSDAIRIALDGTHGTFNGVEVDLLQVDGESIDSELVARGGGSEDADWVSTVSFEITGRFREAVT